MDKDQKQIDVLRAEIGGIKADIRLMKSVMMEIASAQKGEQENKEIESLDELIKQY